MLKCCKLKNKLKLNEKETKKMFNWFAREILKWLWFLVFQVFSTHSSSEWSSDHAVNWGPYETSWETHEKSALQI